MAGGNVTTYGYDKMDRRTLITHDDGSQEVYGFGGTGNDGFVVSMKERPNSGAAYTRTTTYGRDQLGRLASATTPEGTATLDYDKASNLTTYSDGSGKNLAYGYNAADQLTSLTLPGGSCSGLSAAAPGTNTASGCVLFAVDDDGRRTSTVYPGGNVRQDTTLDDSGRVKQTIGKLAGVAKLNLTYSYKDASAPTAGNPDQDSKLVFSVAESAATTPATTNYAYDAYDRVRVSSTVVTATSAEILGERFCYDNAGNRIKYYRNTASNPGCTTGTPSATYTYNDANQLTAATGLTPTGATMTGTGFTYDPDGNETTGKSGIGRTTTYGDRGQATTFTPAGGSAINQAYSGSGNLNRVISGTTTFEPSLLSPTPAESTTGSVNTWTIRDPNGTLIAIRIGSTFYFPFTDNLGNVRAMSQAAATNPAVAYTYSGFGAITSTTGTLIQPYRYGSGYTDDATGLIKLGIRYYDANMGRFTQQDPTRQERHPYMYAGSSPANAVDPSGASILDDALDVLTIADAAEAYSSGDSDELYRILISTTSSLLVAATCEFAAGLAGWPTAGVATVLISAGCTAIAEGVGGEIADAIID